MKCPKCGSVTRVIRAVYSPVDIVVYRRLKCVSCNHIFYTAEVEVELNGTLKDNMSRCRPSRTRTITSKMVKVRCLDTGEVFDSVRGAARVTDATPTGITLCCQGKRKTSGGKRWEYYNAKEVKEDES